MDRQRGLKSLAGAREGRARAKFTRPTPNLLLFAIGGVSISLLIYWFVSSRELAQQKTALLAQQRAAKATVGAEWYPMRDKIEKLTLDAGLTYPGDLIEAEARTWDFRGLPGIYLRMRVEEAKDIASVRRAASESLRDGFTGCLLRSQNAALLRGERDASAFADNPWNLRQAYVATRVLGEEWESEVHAAGDDLRLRVFSQQYDKAKREEIPLVVDIVKRASFFLLVLDEDVPEARAQGDGGAITGEVLQQVPHPARVFIYNIKESKLLVRLRRTGSADIINTGAQPSEETRLAMLRQVNNCSLAQQVWTELRPKDK
jgi:hypothetical protein